MRSVSNGGRGSSVKREIPSSFMVVRLMVGDDDIAGEVRFSLKAADPTRSRPCSNPNAFKNFVCLYLVGI